ncbi:MAG: DUF5119 domain-containing protein [Bacteroidales bacterium]|nr:DUF5119 domain-containing protein [Bacteroidales bacterium]
MKARRLISLGLLLLLVCGCRIDPPLHLRKPVEAKIELVAEVNVDIMWQLNWEARWEFAWSQEVLGPLGYTLPASMRLHIFTQDQTGELVSHTTHNFMGNNIQMGIFVGKHNLLFYNNDSEALLFKQDGDFDDIYCYTRNISSGLKSSSPVYTLQQKALEATKADDPEEEPVSLPPDGLFTLYDPDQVITDNPEDYVYENGRYILKIEGMLDPGTFIYLIQVKLLNNEGRVVGSNGGAAITGMAGGVDLMTRQTFTSTVSVPMDVYMDQGKDMLGARVMTFGIPGCNPYDEASVAAAPQQTHNFVLNVTYINGGYRNIRVDITDQIRALPLGGVINLELDVNDFPPEGGSEGGGFQALIGGWNEEEGSMTIIN